ncbi:MAG: triphosphoribosyl-dephospho-CoA synthase CitG [Treponema sp.]|jgi:holo-ACP synthase/triphosphoribosyl-dephospho-CoA synthase|nr:triphosphoribosyl-dephospho-CoA synthase CitG [Treponema sp.]
MKVTLEEVLAERERRALRQKELLSQYNSPLICLTLNMPGEEKTFPWAERCFHEGEQIILLRLEAEGIAARYAESSTGNAGYAAFLCVDAPAEQVKALACGIEETHPLGRLFDIDVFSAKGEKLSRKKEGRPCLVCGKNAFACARSRVHDVTEVSNAARSLMKRFLRGQLEDSIGTASAKALLYEAAVTPKPGLVDRANSGAHRDMDFFTFIDSSAAITSYFRDCARMGFESAGADVLDPETLFESLRQEGKIAEARMRRAAGGVNTHKGAIFSVGLLSAAYGRLFHADESPALSDIAILVRAMTARLLDDFSRPGCGTEKSHGQGLFEQYGVTGIRGEAAAGFPSVCAHSYPLLSTLLKKGVPPNGAGVAALFSLMSQVDDTNILHRAGIDALQRVQKEAASVLAQYPPEALCQKTGLEALYQKARKLDEQFTAQNISPGGSADLLGVTFFLYFLLNSKARSA